LGSQLEEGEVFIAALVGLLGTKAESEEKVDDPALGVVWTLGKAA
jgi:hypothetical protein